MMKKIFALIVLACTPWLGYAATYDCLIEKEGACIQCMKDKGRVREIVLQQNDTVEFKTTGNDLITLNPSFCTKYSSDQQCPAEHPDRQTCAKFKSSLVDKPFVIISFSVPNDDCSTARFGINKETPVSYQNISNDKIDIKINELKWKC